MGKVKEPPVVTTKIDSLPPPRAPRHAATPDKTHSLDSTKAVELLLRDVTSKVSRAAQKQGIEGEIELLRSAGELTRAFQQAVELAELQPVDWIEITHELQLAFIGFKLLRTKLSRAHQFEPVVALIGAWTQLAPKIDRSAFDPDSTPDHVSPVAAKLSASEQEQLAEQSVVAAMLAADELVAAKPADQSALLEGCQHLRLHVQRAFDSAKTLDKPAAYQLSFRVKELSAKLENLNTYLAAAKKVPWHRSYAALFDRERDLREYVGLTEHPTRAYSGTIDPAQAEKILTAAIPTTDPATSQTKSATLPAIHQVVTPQQAISSMAISVGEAYQQKLVGLDQAFDSLEEIVPEETSGLDKFLMFTAQLLLAATTSALGNLFEAGISAAITAGHRASAGSRVSSAYGDKLDADRRKQLVDGLVEGSSLRRSLEIDVAKDGLLQLAKQAGALGPIDVSSSALTLKNQFKHANQNAISASRFQALHLLNALTPSLLQLDLSVLAKLAHELYRAAPTLKGVANTNAIIQWQNTKARAASPPKRTTLMDFGKQEPVLAGKATAHGEESVPGVLEMGVHVGAEPDDVKLDYLVLRDGEPAAVVALRSPPRRLSALDMNRMYQLSFGSSWLSRRPDGASLGNVAGSAPSVFVKFGVPRSGKVQSSSFTRTELDVLRMYVAGMDPQHYAANLLLHKTSDRHDFTKVTDDAAIAAAIRITNLLSNLTTSELKKG